MNQGLKYRNHYLFATKNLKRIDFEQKVFEFKNHFLLAHKVLPVVCLTSDQNHEKIELIVIGNIINPHNPSQTNEDIAHDLLLAMQDSKTFTKSLMPYSGRFCVFIIRNDSNVEAYPDAMALRQIYYFCESSQKWALSSLPDLLLETYQTQKQIDDQTRAVFESEKFKKSTQYWYGYKWHDTRIQKIFPNHYGFFPEGKIQRFALNKPQTNLTYEQKYKAGFKLLQNTIAAIHMRYEHVYQGITGGYDSRTLMACHSKKDLHKTHWVVFDHSEDMSPDAKVAVKVANKAGINLEVIPPQKLTSEFLNICENEKIILRKIDYRGNIQWFCEKTKDQNAALINGNGSEVLRIKFTQEKERKLSIDDMAKITKFPKLFKARLQEWVDGLEKDESWQWIPNPDLFYWEQVPANWVALGAQEMDLAVETISPYNNREFMLLLLTVPEHKRYPPRFKMYRDIVKLGLEKISKVPYHMVVVNYESVILNQFLARMPGFFRMKTFLKKIKKKLKR